MNKNLPFIPVFFVMLATLSCSFLGFSLVTDDELEEDESFLNDAFDEFVAQQPTMTYIAAYVDGLSGSVDGVVGGVYPEVFPGDNAKDNAAFEGFMTFDLRGLPSTSMQIIDSVLTFGCVTNGYPFHDPPFGLGLLYVDVLDYGNLDDSDYLKEGENVLELDECPHQPVDVTSAVESRIGRDYVQFRLHFLVSNGDFYRDDIVIDNQVLIINYKSLP